MVAIAVHIIAGWGLYLLIRNIILDGCDLNYSDIIAAAGLFVIVAVGARLKPVRQPRNAILGVTIDWSVWEKAGHARFVAFFASYVGSALFATMILLGGSIYWFIAQKTFSQQFLFLYGFYSYAGGYSIAVYYWRVHEHYKRKEILCGLKEQGH